MDRNVMLRVGDFGQSDEVRSCDGCTVLIWETLMGIHGGLMQ